MKLLIIDGTRFVGVGLWGLHFRSTNAFICLAKIPPPGGVISTAAALGLWESP